MYDLTITNPDLLANSSNIKATFPEYWKNIPRISVLKYKKFCGLSCEIFNIRWQSPLLKCFCELYWNRFSLRVIFWKKFISMLDSCYKFQISTIILSIHNIVIIIINNYRHEINVSLCSAQRKIFVSTCVSDIM